MSSQVPALIKCTMKSDRRHELQTNELADWLGDRMAVLQPHATAITTGVIVAAVLLVGGIWYFSGESRAASGNWSAYFAAFNNREPGKALETVAKERPGTTAALWALQAVGDMNLAQGAALLFSDRTEAQKLLQQAEAAYKQVDAGATDPVLKARARLGLGKVYESLCKPDEALKYYESVAESQKGTALGKVAAAAVQRMKSDRDVALLAWFATQTPKKPAPIPGVGGGGPSLPNDLPERPNISLPPGLGLSNIGTATPAEPAPTLPSVGTTTEAAPATDASKSEAPKSTDGKQDTKPGETKAEEPKSKETDAKP